MSYGQEHRLGETLAGAADTFMNSFLSKHKDAGPAGKLNSSPPLPAGGAGFPSIASNSFQPRMERCETSRTKQRPKDAESPTQNRTITLANLCHNFVNFFPAFDTSSTRTTHRESAIAVQAEFLMFLCHIIITNLCSMFLSRLLTTTKIENSNAKV